MISKAQLKELASYKTQKYCELDHVYVVEGVKMCGEALRSSATIRTLCATSAWLEANAQQIGAREGGMLVCEVNDAELERISGQKSPNQVWMLLERPLPSPLALKKTASNANNDFILALDHLQDPGNMGTIMRTADWFGIRTIVCSRDSVSCYNPKVVQSTMGAIFRTDVLYTDLPEFLHSCRANGSRIYGAMLDGQDVYRSQCQQQGSVLVIGNESKGITPEVQACLTHKVLIPNRGGTCESLNASVASAILLSEFFRG